MSANSIRVLRGGTEFAYGFVFGTGTGWEGFAGDLVAGMVFVGDLRDIIKNLCYLAPGGEDPNWLDFTLAVTGLALDIGEIFSAGADTHLNFAVALFRSMLKKLSSPELRNLPQVKRIAAVITEVLFALLREWRMAARGTQFTLVGFSLWPLIKDLWLYVTEGLQIPTSRQELEDLAVTLPERIIPILSLLGNPAILSKLDLQEIGGMLRQYRRAGMGHGDIRRLIDEWTEISAGQRQRFSTDTIRSIGKVLTARWSSNWPVADAKITAKAAGGLGEYIARHGIAEGSKLLNRFQPSTSGKRAFQLLTNMDTAAKTARRLNQFPGAFDDLTHPLKGNRLQRQGAMHELDVLVRYRRFIREIQPRFPDARGVPQQGVDFIIEISGRRVFLEAKALYAIKPNSVKTNAGRIRKQFQDRFKPAGTAAGSGNFAIRYVFRDQRRPNGEEYLKALQKAVKDCIAKGILPANFKLRRRDVRFLGLPRP